MKGYTDNIEAVSINNQSFRKVIYTAKYSQLVVMSLKPGEEIGMEVHEVDQFIKIESGEGTAVLDGVEYDIADGSAIIISAGSKHDIVNNSNRDMKLYTVYSPPEHRDGVEHESKEDALGDAEHFDGKTTQS